MSDISNLRKMMEPLYIGQVKFRNRIVKPGQSMKFAEKDGLVTQKILGFYEALARGGVGMIVVENSCVADIADQQVIHLTVPERAHVLPVVRPDIVDQDGPPRAAVAADQEQPCRV